MDFVLGTAVAKRLGNVFDCLTSSQTKLDRVPRTSKLAGPFGNGFTNPQQVNRLGCSKVVSLFRRGRPSNISGFVTLVVVDPIQRRVGGRVPHVVVERHKIIFPSIANRDAAPSPKIKFFVLCVVASVFHSVPSAVRSCVSFAMNQMGLACLLSLIASARGGFFTSQFAGPHNGCRSTITGAFPEYQGFSVTVGATLGALYNNQPSKSLSGQVYKGRHNGF